MAAKQKEMFCGKTKKQLERVTADLATAQIAREHEKHALTEDLLEGREVTAAPALREADDRVRDLEFILASTQQKHEAAEADLKKAQQLVREEKEAEALTHFKLTVRQWERHLSETAPFAKNFHDVYVKTRAACGGNPDVLYTLDQIHNSLFEKYVYKALRDVLPDRWKEFQYNSLLEKPLSEWAPDPSSVRTVRPTVATVPIPSWQHE